MIRVLCWTSGLLLCGCVSTASHVNTKRCCYPGAHIALARMPSSGDVAINLGSVEHVLIPTPGPPELDAAPPQSSELIEKSSRLASTPTIAKTFPGFSTARSRDADVVVAWLEFARAGDDTIEWKSCPVNDPVRQAP